MLTVFASDEGNEATIVSQANDAIASVADVADLVQGVWSDDSVAALAAAVVDAALLDAKGNYESRCLAPWKCTPLQQTAYHGRVECARLLLQRGASRARTHSVTYF